MTIPDFTRDNPAIQWQRFCDLHWFDAELGIWMDISRMHTSKNDLEKLKPSLQSSFEAMDDLEAGEISNIDENRQVGHYWLRNPQIAPSNEIRDHIISQINEVDDFGKNIHNSTITAPNGSAFTDVFWIGIGGSGLGPLLLVEALKEHNKGLSIHFLDNVDPTGMFNKLQAIKENLNTTLFVTVSKSGGTPEPKIGMEQARNFLEINGGTWNKQSVAITMQNSELYNLASDENWLKIFDLPDWVGGRTSITSSVGLLPAKLIGCDIHQFLAGASHMDKLTREKNYLNNPAALLAIAWWTSGDGKGKRDMVVLPYKDNLEVFSRYLQQLVMESLGKLNDRNGNLISQGISVYGNKGSTDQHAYVQQLRDGLDNHFVNFIEVLDDNDFIKSLNNRNPGDYLSGFLHGTREALSASGKQSLCITLKSFNISTLGALIALFERAVGIYAELVNINAYDQPGVEAGKIAASKILLLKKTIKNILSDNVSRTIEEICTLSQTDSPESIYLLIRHLHANNPKYYIEGDFSNPKSIRVKYINS